MAHDEQTQRFLDSLPEIKPGQSFRFRCHPQVSCFNQCCGDLNLMLTPYDTLRLRRALGRLGHASENAPENTPMPSEPFIRAHVEVGVYPQSGYPFLHLRMAEGPGRPCPFVRPEGCSVYPDRPAACRTYPVGRATRVDENGELVEQFFLVREDHCAGFAEDGEWTTDTWCSDQGLPRYNEVNDRYMRLMSRQRDRGPLPQKFANMALLALYQPDRFRDFVRDTGMLARLGIDAAEGERLLADEEAALEFGMDWLELVIYGDNARLRPA
ncbi:MAG: YkgJ family cysteine cluster protein [Desulfovibrionaceae bacterium]|jgi:Fe-S-cluster containining protein|nr:YkgJ family cysteine cluster protein [Desulfovibrionaceae bacterium]